MKLCRGFRQPPKRTVSDLQIELPLHSLSLFFQVDLHSIAASMTCTTPPKTTLRLLEVEFGDIPNPVLIMSARRWGQHCSTGGRESWEGYAQTRKHEKPQTLKPLTLKPAA